MATDPKSGHKTFSCSGPVPVGRRGLGCQIVSGEEREGEGRREGERRKGMEGEEGKGRKGRGREWRGEWRREGRGGEGTKSGWRKKSREADGRVGGGNGEITDIPTHQ